MTLSSQSSNHDLNKPLHLMAHRGLIPITEGNFFNGLLVFRITDSLKIHDLIRRRGVGHDWSSYGNSGTWHG